MNPAIAAALLAALPKPDAPEDTGSLTPVLGASDPADAAITVGGTFSLQVVVENADALTGDVDYIWYETTSGSPVEIASHRGQSSWTSSQTTAPGDRTFYAEVTHTESGKDTATATSRTATVKVSEAE